MEPNRGGSSPVRSCLDVILLDSCAMMGCVLTLQLRFVEPMPPSHQEIPCFWVESKPTKCGQLVRVPLRCIRCQHHDFRKLQGPFCKKVRPFMLTQGGGGVASCRWSCNGELGGLREPLSGAGEGGFEAGKVQSTCRRPGNSKGAILLFDAFSSSSTPMAIGSHGNTFFFINTFSISSTVFGVLSRGRSWDFG